MITSNDIDQKLYFRDQEDKTHVLTATEALAMSRTVMDWISSIYTVSWPHKDTLAKLIDEEKYSVVQTYNYQEGWTTTV